MKTRRGVALFLLAGALAFFPGLSMAGEVRTFTNQDGKTVEAEFVSENFGIVVIKRQADGKVFYLPLHNLSEEDQAWVRENAAQGGGVEGIWGGKWDDQWKVFVTIEKSDGPADYRVIYNWQEQTDGPLRARDDLGADKEGYIQSGALFIKVSGNTGLLYGKFRRPRMANLVRILVKDQPLEEISLETYGWKEGAIPAPEALQQITGGKE